MIDPRLSSRLLAYIRDSNVVEVKKLLEQGVDPDTKFYLSGSLRSAIGIAVETRSVEIVELLCEKGCSLSSTDGADDDDEPLLLSCKNGDVQIVRILLDRKANIKVVDISGKTPLHLASKSSKASQGEIVNLLLSHKADINARDVDGRTALMYACHASNINAVDILLGHGANVTWQDRQGMTSLHYLCSSTSKTCSSQILMTSLLRKVKNENMKNFVNKRESMSGCTALHCVIQSGAPSDSKVTDMVKILLKFGADINAQNTEGRTPLHYACNFKLFQVSRLLVSSGCILSTHDLLGRPPIIEAARLKEAATLNLLLKANGPDYSQEFLHILQTMFDSSTKDQLIYNLKNPGSLQDLSRRSLVRATICAQNLKENLLPRTLHSFLQFQDCVPQFPYS